MKYQIIFLGISMLLSGCATVPSTKGELIQASPSSQKYCYSEPLAEVTQRLRSYLSACYRPMTVSGSTFAAGVIIPIQSNIDWSVEEEAIASGTRFTVKGLGKYVLSAQVTGPEPTCSTTLQAFAGNQVWTNRFETLDKVARNEKAECPY